MTDLSENVRRGHELGFSFTPLNGKKPKLTGWTTRPRETLEEALKYASQGNVGLRCGAISAPDGKCLIVIDQDAGGDVTALRLPPTVCVNTGRGQHYYFYSDRVIKNTAGKLAENIDTRGEGGQVVYPGSIHPETDTIYQFASGMSLAEQPIADLPDHIAEKLCNGTPTRSAPPVLSPPLAPPKTSLVASYAQAALTSECDAVRNAPHKTRNDTLNTAAFKLGTLIPLGHLSQSDVEQALLSAAEECDLSPDEIMPTIRSGIESGKNKPRDMKNTGQTSNIIAYPEPMRIGEHYLKKHWLTDKGFLLRRYREEFYYFDKVCYRPITNESLDVTLYQHIDNLWTFVVYGGEPKLHAETGENKLRKIVATANVVKEVRLAIPSLGTLIPDDNDAPLWLTANHPFDPKQLLVCQNGILHLPSAKLIPATPELFALNSLGFSYDADAPEPTEWLKFLDSLWPNDPEAIQTLQEWFGYCLLTDTSQQKILLLVGPRRSGKGTIGRVLTTLLGKSNVVGPPLSSLSQNFGLQPLIGKQLAIISDARLSLRVDHAIVVERLLSISGEDSLTIDLKYKAAWTGKLPIRFMIMTNQLPRLTDVSGALVGRFVVITLTETFYGREDHALTDKLLAELAGILNWSIAGWHRLLERGRFIQPKSSTDAMRELEDLGSPIKAFVRDRCQVGNAFSVEANKLFEEWGMWCCEQGRDHPGTVQSFGRDLRAAVPGLQITQPRIGGSRVRHYHGIGFCS